MLLKKHFDVLKDEESKSSQVPPGKISFNYKFFQTHDVAEINMPTCIRVPKSFNFPSMTTDGLVVPPMSFELCALTAHILFGEIKHIEEVIKNSMNKKREIEVVLKLMRIAEKSSILLPPLCQMMMVRLQLLMPDQVEVFFNLPDFFIYHMNNFIFYLFILSL